MAVGVDDHRGWANFVSVAQEDGRLAVVDRRRAELLHPGLPNQPHHHDAQGVPLDQARELVRRVNESIVESCRSALRSLVQDLASRGFHRVTITIRSVPETPHDLGTVLENQNASIAADGALYLRGLAGAAAELGIEVVYYRRKDVKTNAAEALGEGLGPPWTQAHRIAAAAAIGALTPQGES